MIKNKRRNKITENESDKIILRLYHLNKKRKRNRYYNEWF